MSYPPHLDPSELGTKEYWDNYYQNDLSHTPSRLAKDQDSDSEQNDHIASTTKDDTEQDDEDEAAANHPLDPSELESWFSDVGAPTKTLRFLTSPSFPLSPDHLHSTATSRSPSTPSHPSVLDLGTGNGSALFSLRYEGGYVGPMIGVDYSQPSVELARKLNERYLRGHKAGKDGHSLTTPSTPSVRFEVFDLIHDDPRAEDWWPKAQDGFSLVLDKGTFDAVSLSSETITLPGDGGEEVRICEVYPSKAIPLVMVGGYLLITSCNWTQEELVTWFTKDGRDVGGKLEVYDAIKYPTFQFGGQQGQGVASVCFKRTA